MARDFVDLPLEEYLDELGRETRVPGSGPAAALTTAAAASLVAMAARFLRKEWQEARTVVIQAETLRRRAVDLAREDAAVLAAFISERDSPNDARQEARDFQLGRSLERAADVPLAIAAAASDVALLAAHVAEHAEHDVRADAAGAALLAHGAVRAAAHLVEINLAAAGDDERSRSAGKYERTAADAVRRALAAG